jgi:hypothetical protein
MSIWIIVSWVFVALLTAVNVVIFLKLKGASEQMLKMMGSMGAMGGMGGLGAGMKMPPGGVRRGGPQSGQNMDAQLKQAMQMLQNMQKK